MYQKEIRYLLAKLQEWDVAGEGKCSFNEIYQVRMEFYEVRSVFWYSDSML